MRFLVDECTGPAVAHWLQRQGHEVFSVTEDWILVTNDKGLGEKVYRERHPHKGVVLLRLDDERASSKIETMRRLLEGYAERLVDQFVTVTETQVRFARI